MGDGGVQAGLKSPLMAALGCGNPRLGLQTAPTFEKSSKWLCLVKPG